MGASIGVMMTTASETEDPCWPMSYYCKQIVSMRRDRSENDVGYNVIYRENHFDDVVMVRHDGPNRSSLQEFLKIS